jgi:hypothetical protein
LNKETPSNKNLRDNHRVTASSWFTWNREFFLFLLPLFFVLNGFNRNYGLVPWSDVPVLLGLYLAASVVAALLFLLLFRNWRKAAVTAFLLMAFHFFFGPVHDWLKQWLGDSFPVRYSFILPAALLGWVLLVRYIYKTKRPFRRFTNFFNLLLLVLLLIDATQLSYRNMWREKENTAALPPGFTACDTCSRPDIYLIVADEYAGNRELKEVFGFDNSAFENALRQRGFHVAGNSVSNYNFTPFSIASLLNMNYLQGIEGRNSSKSDRDTCYNLINQNTLTRFLRSRGYEFVNNSFFRFAGQAPEEESITFHLVAGKKLITSGTFLSRIDRDIRFNLVSHFKIESEMRNFAYRELNSNNRLIERTRKEAESHDGNPRFIYTHLMMPHYPYFFDSSGKANPIETLMENQQVQKEKYIGYLQYSNRIFLQLIDHILAHSKTPPIIIFMGDHGFRHLPPSVDKSYHFMNFSSIHLPNKNHPPLPDTLSSVNQFRILLNLQFGQQLPLLKDSTSFLQE